MRSKLLSMVIGAAALSAAVLVSQVPGVAQAAPLTALAPAAGAATPTPSTGGSDTLFGLTLPTGANCQNTGTFGYRLHGFIAPISVDVASLTWANGAPVGNALAKNSFDNGGTAFVNNFPGDAPVLGVISNIPVNFQLSAGGVYGPGAYTPGIYQIGVACTFPDAGGVYRTEKFYASRITITTNTAVSGGGAQINFANGAVPDAPALTTSSYNAGTSTTTVNFTSTASTPATTGFTATLVPVGGATPIAPISVAAGATSFNVPGVVLGSSYTVTLTAANTTGTSAASNSLTIAGSVNATAPVVNAPDAFEGNPVTVTWTAPTSPTTPAPVSYNVAVTPGGPSFTGVTGLSQVIPAGLAIGGYTATVTPVYAAGSGVTGVAGFDGFSITPNTLITQRITVTRPPGAIILTQRCGVFGPLAPFVGVDTFPGFPVRPLTPGAWTGTLPALVASADQIGTSPDINPTLPGVQVDPEFANYPEPSPVTYPTQCGLSMGTARFVTSGALAGQFYTATGRLNQVTVLDTRDTDSGWIARGDIDDNLVGTTGNTFSGDYLGWAPAVASTSDPIPGSGGYDQIVTAGPAVLPGSNVTVANQAAQTGMTENPILSSSLANQGLGIASMDARMNLLIPASADAADYSAILSLTVVPRP